MYIVYTKHGLKLFHASKKVSTFYGPKAFQAEVDYLLETGTLYIHTVT